jgi:predicted component of type VI protein secretion system
MPVLLQWHKGQVTGKVRFARFASLGRSAENDVQLEDKTVSALHAHIVQQTPEDPTSPFELVDLSSTNGSFVNDRKITRQTLREGDQIRLGLMPLSFHLNDTAELEQTAQVHKSWIPGIFYTRD